MIIWFSFQFVCSCGELLYLFIYICILAIPASLGRNLLDHGWWYFWCFLDSVCKYFFIYVHKRSWSAILFLCWVFMWFEYQSNCDLIKRNWAIFLLFLFCEIIWRALALILLWKSDRIWAKTIWSWPLLIRRLLTMASISLDLLILINFTKQNVLKKSIH